MSIRVPAVMAAAIVALLVMPVPCAACSCVEMTDAEMVDHVDMVFRGKAIEIHDRFMDDSYVLIQVDTVWKGELPSSTVKVASGHGGGDCTVAFREGSTYVVLAHQQGNSDVLGTSICSGTGMLSANAVTAIAGEGTPVEQVPLVPVETGDAEARSSDDSIWLWLAGGAVAGAAGVIVWRRRVVNSG